MDETETVSARVHALVSEARRLILSTWPACVMYLAITTSAFVYSDMYVVEFGPSLWVMVVSFVAGYVLTRTMVANGVRGDGTVTGGIGRYFVLGLVNTIAIGFGLLLLVVPGMIMMVRWLPAYGFAHDADEGAIDSLQKSWDATRGHSWPMLIVSFIPIVAIFASAAPVILADIAEDFSDNGVELWESLLVNSVVSLVTIAITAIGLASYVLLHRNDDDVGEVFD